MEKEKTIDDKNINISKEIKQGEGDNNILVQEKVEANEIALKPEEEKEKIKEGLSIEKIGTENIIEGDKIQSEENKEKAIDIAIQPGTEGSFQIQKINDEKQQDFIELIRPMNIEARYPDYKRNIAKSLNEASARHILEQTKEIIQWIHQKF